MNPSGSERQKHERTETRAFMSYPTCTMTSFIINTEKVDINVQRKSTGKRNIWIWKWKRLIRSYFFWNVFGYIRNHWAKEANEQRDNLTLIPGRRFTYNATKHSNIKSCLFLTLPVLVGNSVFLAPGQAGAHSSRHQSGKVVSATAVWWRHRADGLR